MFYVSHRKARHFSRRHYSADDDPTRSWSQKEFNIQPFDERYQLGSMGVSHKRWLVLRQPR